jgi:hypothetical protein
MIDRILRRLSLRARIFGAVMTLFVLLAVMVLATVLSLLALRRQLEMVTNVQARAERLLLNAQVSVISSRVNLMRYMTDVVPGVSDAVADVDEASAMLEEAGGLLGSSGQAVEINVLLEGLAEYRTLINNVQKARLEAVREI